MKSNNTQTKNKNKTIMVGLTGQSGAGKTTIGEYFVDCGFGVINCDIVSRKVVSDGSDCLDRLVAEFSEAILNKEGKLNRKALGAIVFNDNEKLLKLNDIIFPYIIAKIKNVISCLEDAGFNIIVLDAPTLFESGIDRMCDIIISVIANKDVRIKRVMERDNISEIEATNRVDSQYEDNFYTSQSDFIIENNNSQYALIPTLSRTCEFIRNYKKQST